MRLKSYLVVGMIVFIGTLMAIVAIHAIDNFMYRSATTLAAVHDRPAWESVASENWGFAALFPTAFEHKHLSVGTPFGDAPLETWISEVGPVRYTIAVAEYDPRVAKSFSEEDRYDSAEKEAPKFLGGDLVRNNRVRLGDLEGREKVIKMPGAASLHSREFIVGDRSYQIQVAYPPGGEPKAADEERFLRSLVIDYRPANKRVADTDASESRPAKKQ